MCAEGDGSLEIRDSSNKLLNVYRLTHATSNTTTSPITTNTTCSSSSLSSATTTQSGTWSSADCTSSLRTGSYIDFYQLTSANSTRVQIDLTSSTDTYLLFYNGLNASNDPEEENDDGGDGYNSRLTMDLTGGRTYTIGATTYSSAATGSYQLQLTDLGSGNNTPPHVPVVAPATPVRPVATAGNGQVTLNWDDITHANSYDVQQWNNTTRSWDTLPNGRTTISFSGSSAVVSGLANGVTYYHHVRATNSVYQSGWSRYSTSRPTVSLTLPTGLSGTGYSSGHINLNWADVTNAASYEVQQWNGRASSWQTLPFTESHLTTAYSITFSGYSVRISGLPRGITYSHRIRAVNGSVVTGWTSHINTNVS